jgi:hypothetical protein
MANPAGYASDKTLLVPDHAALGFWSAVQNGPFDLSEVQGSGFSGTVLVLNHITRRGKETSSVTRPIPGIWIPYEADEVVEKPVTANAAPYFVFTSMLGGCALGIRDLNKAQTTFTHDAIGRQAKNLAGSAVTLMPSAYDPSGSGLNVTAFFWWDGTRWQLGRSATYDAHGLCQTFGDVADKYPKKMGAA